MSLFALTPDDTLATDLGPIADGTGGKVTAVADDASDVAAALLRTMDLVANPLSAQLAKPQAVYAGHPFTLNAGGSSFPPGTQFSFDANGDGSADAVGAAPAQMVQVAKAGQYTATVEMHDTNGRSATAQVAYSVVDASTRQRVADRPERFMPWPPRPRHVVALAALVLILLGTYWSGWRAGKARRRPLGRNRGLAK